MGSPAGPGPVRSAPAARSPLFFVGVAIAVLMSSGVLALWRSRHGATGTAKSVASRGNARAEVADSAGSRDEGAPPPRFVLAPALLEKDGEVRVIRSRAYRRRRPQGESSRDTEGPTLRREEEREGPPRSPAVVARERQLRQTLETLTKGHPAVQIGFADCGSADCIARVQSAQAADIERFAAEARKSGTFEVPRVRERLTAYHGRLWEVDLIVMSKGAGGPSQAPR